MTDVSMGLLWRSSRRNYAVMGAGHKVIEALLGLSDSASTERYTHIPRGVTAALVEPRWLRLPSLDVAR